MAWNQDSKVFGGSNQGDKGHKHVDSTDENIAEFLNIKYNFKPTNGAKFQEGKEIFEGPPFNYNSVSGVITTKYSKKEYFEKF